MLILPLVGALWLLAYRTNARRTRACDGSGDPDGDIVVFVEALRWLFIVWGFPRFCRGLRRGGCNHYVRLFRWSGPSGALLVLPDYVRRRRLAGHARRLAGFLDELAQRYPGRVIHLVGYSTGCFVAAEAVKHVQCPGNIGELILLAGAISPGYDARRLADRVSGLHVFHSYRDFVISGLAPLLFGCNDGLRGPACGMVGLRPQAGRYPEGFLTQHCWSASAVRLGYFGDHFSITSSAFVARRIAPLLGGSSTRCNAPNR